VIVVDASVALKWVIDEKHSDLALALAERCGRTGELAIGPYLLPFEVTNVIHKHIRRAGGSLEDARTLVRRFEAFGVEMRNPPGLHAAAIEIAVRYGLGRTYDVHYVALAAATGATLWTADERLVNSLRGDFAFVRWLAQFDG
jgi:predicted nucleic acid-binding protein